MYVREINSCQRDREEEISAILLRCVHRTRGRCCLSELLIQCLLGRFRSQGCYLRCLMRMTCTSEWIPNGGRSVPPQCLQLETSYVGVEQSHDANIAVWIVAMVWHSTRYVATGDASLRVPPLRVPYHASQSKHKSMQSHERTRSRQPPTGVSM